MIGIEKALSILEIDRIEDNTFSFKRTKLLKNKPALDFNWNWVLHLVRTYKHWRGECPELEACLHAGHVVKGWREDPTKPCQGWGHGFFKALIWTPFLYFVPASTEEFRGIYYAKYYCGGWWNKIVAWEKWRCEVFFFKRKGKRKKNTNKG